MPNAMKPTPEEIAALANQIASVESRLQNLEWEIEEIGQPAAHELQRRLDSLKVEEHALKRNLEEALGMDDPGEARMAKIEALLAYIQGEEAAVEREAEFLHQSPPTSAEFAAQAGSRLMELCLRALKRVVGDHHPLGTSVFVNHSPQLLAERYGIDGANTAPETRENGG
jgi:chromosome segregation ATPase